MSKHTPGPWYIGREAGDQSRHIYAPITVRNDEGDEWNPLVACTDDAEVMINFEANARLIAAAPELLEALKKLSALVRGECPSLLDEDSGGDARLDIEIDDAIAKAEGGRHE